MTVDAERDFTDLAADVDAAVRRAAELDEDARGRADDLRSAIEAFHRPALVRIVQTLRDDARGKELLFELVDDPAVRAVLGLHGIIRPDPTTRAQRALATVRPYLQSHGGDVELVAIDGTVARVRLHGSCSGCSMSATTLREVVEEALVELVDEIAAVEVVEDTPTAAFIPVAAIGRKPDTGWKRACPLADVADGRVLPIDVDGEQVVAVLVDQRVAVFRDACPHQGRSLAGGDCTDGVLRCPWHGFTYDVSSGECLSAPGVQLTQVPTRVEDGIVWVRP